MKFSISRWYSYRWIANCQHCDCKSVNFHISNSAWYYWNSLHTGLHNFQLHLPTKKVTQYYCYNIMLNVFNICRVIRLSSPNLNYIIGIGAIMLYITIILLTISRETKETAVVIPSVCALHIMCLCENTFFSTVRHMPKQYWVLSKLWNNIK